MEIAFSHLEQQQHYIKENTSSTTHHFKQLKHCIPNLKTCSSSNPFQILGIRVPKSFRCCGGRFSNSVCVKGVNFSGMVVNNSVFSVEVQMEECKVEKFVDLVEEEGRQSCSESDLLTISEVAGNEVRSQSSSEFSYPSPASSIVWPIQKVASPHCTATSYQSSEDVEKPHLDCRKLEKQGSTMSEIEMMKERFSKLLLGEDMSGSGSGVSTALAISNAITNLCATIFGQLWRIEPLPDEKKSMWKREMEWLLCVSDHIVELTPSWQTFPDGSKLEIMTCRPRPDLYANLPALRKLDNMLLEILDSFENTEFWYVDQGILPTEGDGSSSFRKCAQRQEDKWWLPVPQVPPGGLHEDSRKHLQHKRDCSNQILKAAMAINSITLSEIEVPESYLEGLPKNGRASLGDIIYRYITSEQFSPECLLDCIDLSSEHQALEIANRVEASIYLWRRRTHSKPVNGTNRSSSRYSWDKVKDLMVDAEKRELLADRAESLLLCLKQRFPGLPQTTLDMSKIQCNKDVGKAILESYSRVLESLAFNIVARIDDLLYVDDLTKHSDQFSSLSISKGLIGHKAVVIPYSVPVSSTPYKTAYTTPNFSPAHLISPAKEERSPFLGSNKLLHRGIGVKKVLTNYLSVDAKGKDSSNQSDGSDSVVSIIREDATSQTDEEFLDYVKEPDGLAPRGSTVG